MFTLFPAQADNLLDVAALPDTSKTELNYRTRPLTETQENRLAILLLLCPIPLALILAIPIWLLIQGIGGFDVLLNFVCLACVGWMFFRWLSQAFRRWEVAFCLLIPLAALLATIWEHSVLTNEWAWRLAILLTWATCGLIAHQVSAWFVAGPTVDYETGERWKVNHPRIFGFRYSLDCPELLAFSLSALLIGPAWLASIHLSSFIWGVYWVWPMTLPIAYIGLWLLSHVLLIPFIPFPNAIRSASATWQAIRIFLSYDIYYTPAAGVFRFPTKWLRRPQFRWVLVASCLISVGFGFASAFPSPVAAVESGANFWGQVGANFILMSLSGPIVLLSTLWFVAGATLARFENELFAALSSETSEWDNYVDRIINSDDELEREHLLFGTTEKGDYPVLVHKDIFDQHVHVLGDSGASKTALNIAPQATQLIARADSSVVVVDLKGDYALFQSCRREAKRAGLKFRWITNEVGKSTFGFNPFLQTHNQLLSVEQLTQQLLQGMSLDYGIQYGAGYFTAMNEIVLKNVLKETGDRSFKELGKHLSDRNWYEKIGQKDDWAQARHLAALVSRLGASAPLNVVPDMFTDRPEVIENSIDTTDVVNNPQVVYLFLRSPVEPTNAPTIARLFLWCMFNAASRRPQDSNRIYFFIDEIQQIVSDGIKLIFEQFRDLGGTLIAAHQTSGQLRRQGSDLGDTIDSCTAVKQTFRASDLRSVEMLEKLSGTHNEISPTWYQTHERGFGDLVDRYHPMHAAEGQVRMSEKESPRLTRQKILEVGSKRHSSLLRFTFGSGYTQFSGATLPVVSQFHISFNEYIRRRQLPWPTHPGAFDIQLPSVDPADKSDDVLDGAKSDEFTELFDKRSREALSG